MASFPKYRTLTPFFPRLESVLSGFVSASLTLEISTPDLLSSTDPITLLTK